MPITSFYSLINKPINITIILSILSSNNKNSFKDQTAAIFSFPTNTTNNVYKMFSYFIWKGIHKSVTESKFQQISNIPIQENINISKIHHLSNLPNFSL